VVGRIASCHDTYVTDCDVIFYVYMRTCGEVK